MEFIVSILIECTQNPLAIPVKILTTEPLLTFISITSAKYINILQVTEYRLLHAVTEARPSSRQDSNACD